MPLDIQEDENGCTIKVHLQPRAHKERILGLHGDALKVSITAAPIEGQANDACIAFFARLRCVRIVVAIPMETLMRLFLASAVIAATVPCNAFAALDIGEHAPDFSAQAAVAGSVYSFSLAESLKKGPVVVYFFPAAFSEGCSVEAHSFAEAIPEFKALGASVVGVSGDDIGTLRQLGERLKTILRSSARHRQSALREEGLQL